MFPEKKILLSVLLLALAQRDPNNIKHIDTRRESRAEIAQDAVEFVASEQFALMAKVIEANPAQLRKMTPGEAQEAFELLISDKKESTE